MIMCRFRICVVVIIAFIFVEAKKEKCEKCMPADQCSFYGSLNAEEQEKWIDRYNCPKSENGHLDRHTFGFSSTAKGDVVCCPNNVWGMNNQNGGLNNQDNFNDNTKYNTPSDFRPQNENNNNFNRQKYDHNRQMNDYTHQSNNFNNDFNPNNQDTNIEPQRWNPTTQPNQRQGFNRGWDRNQNQGYNRNQNQGFNRNQNQGYNKNENQGFIGNQNQGFNRNQNQGFNRNQNGGYNGRLYQDVNNNDQSFIRNQGVYENPNYNRRNENFGVADQGKQCPITSFPPNPEGGCCGREATDADRIAGSPYAPSNRFPVPSPSWTPRHSPNSQAVPPGWSSLWNPMDDFQNYMPRFKREDNVTIGNRIAGGKETELEQYPWTVLITTTFNYGTRESSFNCGGSIISSRYILTAAHCVVEENARVKGVEVHLAEYDKRTFPIDCKNVLGKGRKCIENIVMQAEDIIPHPKYDDNRLHNDIALIRLRSAAPYTDYIRPICLPPINIDNPDLYNLRLAVAGWGRNGQYKSDIKQSTIVNLVPNSECKQFYPSLSKAHLCAAGYSGEDTCKGDSGGPLMILYEGKYYVSGVVSGKRADAPCGTSVPSLYTNVYQFLPWIRSNIKG